MNTTTEMMGGCACGAAQFTLREAPMFVHCCHCSWCQRETGSAFAINALIESSYLTLVKGSVEVIAMPSNSGSGQNVTRCNVCKTALWSNYGAAKEAVAFVRVGTLNEPSLCPPDIHIFTTTKQRWLSLGDTIPVMPEYYQRSKYWPEKSVARYKRALSEIKTDH